MGEVPTGRAALVAAAVLLAAGCSTSAGPGLALLDRPATGADAIPEGIDLGREYDEIRHVGEADGALVYAARGPADQPWCVLVVLAGAVEDGDWVAGASCTDDEHFDQRGVWTTVRGAQGQEGGALLLPDDFDGEVPDGWEVVDPNLAVPEA